MAIVGSDQITIVDLTDGYSVFMSPESHVLPATATSATAGNIPVLISALRGSEPIPATVSLPLAGLPSGFSVTKDSNAITPTLTIAWTTAVTTGGYIDIPVVVDGITIVKRWTYNLAKTGAGGVSATSVALSNDAIVIPTDSTGKTTSASAITIDVYGRVGSGRVNNTITVGGLPTSGIVVRATGGITNGTTTADGRVILDVANANNLGGGTQGNIQITSVLNGQTIVKDFTWAKSIAGDAGADAITMVVVSQFGTIFKNSSIATTLTANVFRGGTLLTAGEVSPLGTVKWYKDNVYLPNKDGLTLAVAPGDVTDKATYEARLEK